MPSLYRTIEICIYSLLNFLPFLSLAIYPFRRSLRFGKNITILLISVLTCLQLIIGFIAASPAGERASVLSAVSTGLYAAFYFLAVKKHFGKTLFTLLMISNTANMAVISAKCLEGWLFPSLAHQSYRWSFSLMLFIVEAVISVPIFVYMKRVYTPAVEDEPSGIEWRYLWLIPATFYMMWYYAIYFNKSRSSLEVALRPGNAIFLCVINIGASLIYYIVAKLISEQKKAMELKESNHALIMQSMQYNNLKDKIIEARRAKHDVRHHIALMQEYLNAGDYDALRKYLSEYCSSLPDDTLIRFCENSAANAVLLYYAQQAKNCGIDYSVKADIAENIGIAETDLAVMLGNLLENALDACKDEQSKDKKIVIRAKADGGSLCVTVDNTFSKELQTDSDGSYISTKHKGHGLGTESVRAIAEKYGGVFRSEAKDGMFFASVICFTAGEAQ